MIKTNDTVIIASGTEFTLCDDATKTITGRKNRIWIHGTFLDERPNGKALVEIEDNNEEKRQVMCDLCRVLGKHLQGIVKEKSEETVIIDFIPHFTGKDPHRIEIAHEDFTTPTEIGKIEINKKYTFIEGEDLKIQIINGEG